MTSKILVDSRFQTPSKSSAALGFVSVDIGKRAAGSLARSNAKLAIASLRDSSDDDDSNDLLRAETLLASLRQRSCSFQCLQLAHTHIVDLLRPSAQHICIILLCHTSWLKHKRHTHIYTPYVYQ